MYLFQHPGGAAPAQSGVDLHSTMYLFQPNFFLNQNPVHHHLHSTMYLFQLAMSSYLDFWIDFIYIPLCIYFNYRKESRIPDCIKFTFHYVSISTYFLCLKYNITSLFTFHYVSISTFALLDDPSDSSSFTFHYVSISTVDNISISQQMMIFTFHYVSISTYKYRTKHCQ